MWKTGRFALLLTDLHMPRRDGYNLAEAIRLEEKIAGRKPAPIVALSANVATDEIERCRSAGIDDFIAKPAPLVLLANTLQRYLPLQRLTTPSSATRSTAASMPATEAAFDRGLIEDFLHTTHEDVVALRAALVRNDAAAVAREAHRIKGASALVGATALAAAAARIEGAAQAGNVAPAQAHLQELEAEVARFAAASGMHAV